MAGGPDRLVSWALFVTLGLVGAFVVSAVAGARDDDPVGTGVRAADPYTARPGQVRVEVLNGAGTTGLARDATYRLRGDGFDVVFFGNADHFQHDRSVIIDRVGTPERARAVAAALGVDSVVTDVDSSLMLEVTVILGDDWPPAPPPDRGWLDRIQELLGGEEADTVPGEEPDPAASDGS